MSHKKPNIVYILTDDQGYGDVSALNPYSKLHTQNADRLAQEGMIFTDMHSGSAVCTPSRYGILTGRYCWRSSLKESVNFGYSPHLIEDDRRTVADLLRDNGYHTACLGKWHLGWDWARNSDAPEDVDFTKPIAHGPTSNGFDEFFGFSGSLDMPPYVWVHGDMPTAVPDRVTVDEGMRFWREGPTAPDFEHEQVLPELTRRAVSYIDQHADEEKPFFLYLPLPAPHTPILPTPEFQGKSGTNPYGDFVLMVDWTVGEVLDALERNGFEQDTIVIFTSDNGCSPMADFSELEALGHYPSYHFRGHKADIYEGGHRIPFLLRWPAKVAAGTTCNDILSLTDLLATCADIVGADVPDDMGEDSASILPAMLQKPRPTPIHEAVVNHSINGSFALRMGKWKLEMCPGSGGWSAPKPDSPEEEGLPPIQLYDLESDIGERVNVQADHPDVVAELTRVLDQYVTSGRSTPGTPQPNTGPARWPQLWWMASGK